MHKVRQSKAKEGKARQSKVKQGKARQRKANSCKICSQSAHELPNPPKCLPKPSPNPSKTLPKSIKIDPKGFLEPILDQCFKKIRFWRAKKRPRSAQECPRDAPDRPKPLPNGAQDPSKSNFFLIFGLAFSNSNFTSIFFRFFLAFYRFLTSSKQWKQWFFPRKTLFFWKTQFSITIRKDNEKTSQKPPPNLPKTSKNLLKIKKIDEKSQRDIRCAKKAKKMRKNRKSANFMRILKEIGGMAEALSEARIHRI